MASISWGVLCPFLIGYGGPCAFLLYATAYQMYYNFQELVSTRHGIRNVFPSVSRVTTEVPWFYGWIAAMIVHFLFALWINSDCARFWHDRKRLLPAGQRKPYIEKAKKALGLHWERALCLCVIALSDIPYCECFHDTFTASYFLIDLCYFHALNDAEEKLFTHCRDSTVARLRFHHRTASMLMLVVCLVAVLSFVLHVFTDVDYAHSVFGFLQFTYGALHGWHELATSVLVVAGGRARHRAPPPGVELETVDAAVPVDPGEGPVRSRRLQGLPPEVEA